MLAPQLKALFDREMPAQLRLTAVLNGQMPCKVFTDDKTWVVVPTYWNCNAENTPSVRIARKLGYQTERAYTLIAWL